MKTAVNLSDYGPMGFWMEQPLYSLEKWVKLINEKHKRIEKNMKNKGR